MPTTSIFTDHADTYAAWSVINPVNCYYDRPTILRLIGDIEGKHLLELGCAAGVFTECLVEQGANVTAVDVEPQMIEYARKRLGTKARFAVADLEQPPPNIVPHGSLDLVVASLVLHYIRDWTPLLKELHDYLKPGGALVFSLHHPIAAWALSDQTDYHRTELVSEQWDWGCVSVTATSYRRPLSSIFNELKRAGFTIDALEEPQIQAQPNLDDDLLHTLNTKPFFLFIRAIRNT